MKIINIFLIMLLLSSNIFAQFSQPKQITDFEYDSRNPAFIRWPMNQPFYNFPGEVFFEAHTDSSINIYSMIYSVDDDSFMQPVLNYRR